MIDARQEKAAALYSRNLLDESAKHAFEAELAQNPELQQRVAELQSRSPNSPKNSPVPVSGGFSLLASAGWAVAAIFALSTAYFGTRYFTTQSESKILKIGSELASVENQALHQQLEAERILAAKQISDLKAAIDVASLQLARLLPPLDPTSRSFAIVVWDPTRQEGALCIEDLPTLATDQAYQLWAADADGAHPVSACLFFPNKTGALRLGFHLTPPLSGVARFSVTREPKGGSPTPSTLPLLAGSVWRESQ